MYERERVREREWEREREREKKRDRVREWEKEAVIPLTSPSIGNPSRSNSSVNFSNNPESLEGSPGSDFILLKIKKIK